MTDRNFDSRTAPLNARLRRVRSGLAAGSMLLMLAGIGAAAADDTEGAADSSGDGIGHPTFASPHARPIAIAGSYVYVANTPADTIDVIEASTQDLSARINVGVDPVSVAVRPDGSEVWVANHVSDTVSVIDADSTSDTFQQVIATVQDIDSDSLSTRFDEPVGIAFANDSKAYVALSTSNRIAVVDVATRTVTGHLAIAAQDPRAIAVRGDRLYVTAFESNNQSQLSGCLPWNLNEDTCTFDVLEHVVSNNNVLSAGYDADIVKNPGVPDRDLFVFDTVTDEQKEIVTRVGTLLYGLAVDADHRIFIAQTDARNVENGSAGTLKDGLAEMQNRAFLNQITRIDCTDGCGTPVRYDLEPLPPQHPEAGMALATPFGIQVSDDNTTLVVTAAGSDKLFTVDAGTGEVSGRVSVGAAPRGIALVSDDTGAPKAAWVLNAVGNTVSLVDLAATEPAVTATVTLEDPTHPDVKRGRIAFNNAAASSTGTFSCESCHPDAHTDQLLWVLDTPACDVEGCTQIPPRLTMPVRGLRDTAPYHWDGIPGDPFGGNNTASINASVDPNCAADDAESCTRHLVDGTLAATMCDQANCPTNDEEKAGLLDAGDRDALARFLLSVPYPPSKTRPFDNVLTPAARDGFFEFSFINDAAGQTTGAPTCGSCHKLPFLVSTNTPGTGMDAPTWRGAYDRWMLLPQGRVNVIDLMNIAGMDDSFPERDMWILAGATPDIWEMVVQGSTGFSGSFARQITLNADTAALPITGSVLDALELSASEGAIRLQGEGVRIEAGAASPLAVEFTDGAYQVRDGEDTFSRAGLIEQSGAGNLVLTLTGRSGINVDVDNPQPALWPVEPIQAQLRQVDIPILSESSTLRLNGRHVLEGASSFIDGRLAGGTVECDEGEFPDCDTEVLVVTLNELPEPGGLHFLQLQNPEGLFSNDLMFFSEQSALPARPGNLIAGGGSFTPGEDQFEDHWNTVEMVTNSIHEIGGEVRIDLKSGSLFPWHAQISHPVMVVAGQQYSLCYDARAQGPRFITAYLDSNLDEWRNISGGQHRAHLSTTYQSFHHTFTVAETDLFARVAFDFAQSLPDVQMDNIGVYEGSECGMP